MMLGACVTLAMLATASASGFLQSPPEPSDVSALKEQVSNSEVFQKKVSVLCQQSTDQAACSAKTTDALFCQLLQRSKPEAAAAHCSAPVAHRPRAASLLQSGSAPKPTMAEMKVRIEGTADFKEETVKMASAMGCNGVKKASNCQGYVQDVAFCLAFADQMKSFASVDGVKAEADHCKTIDKQLPELAMFLQSKFSFVQVSNHKGKAPEDEL